MNQKDIRPLSRATSGKGKKHNPCVVGSGDQGWYNISKVSQPFPLSPLTVILLYAFDRFPGSWSRPPQTLGIYCFIGYEMTYGRLNEKHSGTDWSKKI